MPKKIDLEDGVYSFKWKDKEYVMYSASLNLVRRFKEKIDQKETNEIDLMIEFLEGCGVPKEIVSDMPVGIVQRLFEICSGAEKKS